MSVTEIGNQYLFYCHGSFLADLEIVGFGTEDFW